VKYIFTSQRVDIAANYNEKRDCLDQRWADFLHACGYILISVPNHTETVETMLKSFAPSGILLTGGNSPAPYEGNSPERDKTDALLLDYAVSANIPLMGVCRGMQSIVLYFGGTLKEVPNHVSAIHSIHGNINREVNSYHSLSVNSMPSELSVLAKTKDGNIEAIKHNRYNIIGIMWHPERETSFCKEDIKMFKELFL
jgi:putative glutamine amidotransferase